MSPGSGLSSFLSSKLSGLFFDDGDSDEEGEKKGDKGPEIKEMDYEPSAPKKKEQRDEKLAKRKELKEEAPLRVEPKKKMDAIREETFEWDPHAEFDRLLEALDSLNPDAREHGLKMLDGLMDENKVACIAIFSKNKEARDAALERIERNPHLLSVVYSETRFGDTSDEALDKLVSMLDNMANPDGLVIIACNHHDQEKRLKAVRGLKEADALLEVAYNSRYEDGRWEAIESLKGMDIVIAKQDLRNDETLGGLVDSLVRSSATENDIVDYMRIMLENVKYLDGYSRKNEFDDVIRDNLESYYKMLQNIATSSRHTKARGIALDALSDNPAQLSEVVQHAEYEDTSDRAVELLSSCLGKGATQQALGLVASFSKEAERRSKAVERIDDEETLGYVTRHSKFEDSKNSAIRRLSSRASQLQQEETLRLVIAYASDPKSRASAEKRFAELMESQSIAMKKLKAKDISEVLPKENRSPIADEEDRRPSMKDRDEPPERPNERSGLFSALRDLIGI